MQYYIISTKWTHKKEKYFTMWRTGGRGYTIFIGDAGLFDAGEALNIQEDKQRGAVWVKKEIVDNLSQSSDFEGNYKTMLANNKKNREALGIDISECVALNCYKY